MKSFLIDKLVKNAANAPSSGFKVKHEGVEYEGWGMAKPCNHDKEYMDVETRIGMAIEVLMGRAIAVHYTEDEIASGETPTLLLEHLEEEKRKREYAEQAKAEATPDGGKEIVKDETKPTEGSEATGGGSSETTGGEKDA